MAKAICEGTCGMRLNYLQLKSWDRFLDKGGDPYSRNHCLFCGRPVNDGRSSLLLVSRDEGGSWYLCRPGDHAEVDEIKFCGGNKHADWARFLLPIGPECLKKHPEFKFSIVVKGWPDDSRSV